MIPPGVIRNRTEGVHREDIGRRSEHSHRRDGGAKKTRMGHPAQITQVIGSKDGNGDHTDGNRRALQSYSHTGNDIGRRPGLGGFHDRLNRTVFVFCIILRDIDKCLRHSDTDDAAKEKIKPRRACFRMLRGIDGKHPPGGKEEPDNGQSTSDVITAI